MVSEKWLGEHENYKHSLKPDNGDIENHATEFQLESSCSNSRSCRI